MNIPDPIQFVRNTYSPHAIETTEQEEFVKKFDIQKLFADKNIKSGEDVTCSGIFGCLKKIFSKNISIG